MRLIALTMAMLALCPGPAFAQAVIDDADADISVLSPDYSNSSGPVVAIDSGHHNYSTIEHNFGPFASLLRNDGFQVIDSKVLFSRETLSNFRVLVIANALPAALEGDWKLPASSAFTQVEIDALRTWVTGGGSLLLIADHRPLAGSASDLARAFGFRFEDGIVARDPMEGQPEIFARADGSLRDDVVTRGRDSSEQIASLRAFGGSGFRAPPNARALMVFPFGYMNHACGLPCPAGVPETDATGMLQGAVMPFGKGRIAVFGEAGMFSAQVLTTFTPAFRFGFQAKGAEQNKQFILNVMQWLARMLPE